MHVHGYICVCACTVMPMCVGKGQRTRVVLWVSSTLVFQAGSLAGPKRIKQSECLAIKSLVYLSLSIQTGIASVHTAPAIEK